MPKWCFQVESCSANQTGVQTNMVFLNSRSVVLESQSREQTMESKRQHLNTEYTDRTNGSKEHHSDKAVTSIAAEVSTKQTEIGTDERKGRQKNKMRERRYSSATWGVALRKPSRERKKVRAYSPSKEWNFSKRAKLGLGKAGKYDTSIVKKYKSKGGQFKQQDSGASKENSTVAGNGNVSKCKSVSDATTDKVSMSDPKGYSDEFKHFIEEEIKRQILNQLGEACKSAEIEAIEVEDIGRDTGSHIHEEQDSVLLDQHYMAKTKLKVTLLLPVTLRAGERPPKDFQKPMEAADTQPAARSELKVRDISPHDGIEAKKAELMEDTDDIKGPESTSMFEDIREPEPRRGLKESYTRESELRRGLKESYTREPDPGELMEPDKLNNEPQLGSERNPEPGRGLKESDTREPEPRGGLEESNTREPGLRGLMVPEKFDNEPQLESESSEEIEVPESEFYDFVCERSVDKFLPGQIWASYDNKKDVMPRDYMRIEKVASVDPFKLQITLLQPRGAANWVKAGNALACGEFCIDNILRGMDHIDGFSHLMNYEKGQNDIIYIYPAEKEVWALYKDWKELDPNKRINLGFEIVKIISAERNNSVSVVPLVNFKGSRTVFVQQEVEVFKIHMRDFIRFSHQIPTYEILDLEGCMELDPAATPH